MGRLAGRNDCAALIAACTSCSATSISRLKVNCSVITEAPSELVDRIWFRPGTSPSCRSSGAVTEEATTDGLGPGEKDFFRTRLLLPGRRCGSLRVVLAGAAHHNFYSVLESVKAVGNESLSR